MDAEKDAEKTLLDWIAIDSITGAEGAYGDAVERRLRSLGLDTERQEIEPGRFNVLACAGEPDVVFCTHLDTVPPFIGPSADREFVHGRGACDAKGVALAMTLAAERLLKSGKDRIGFLLTVGEELDAVGARRAESEPRFTPRFTVVGEPTENRFVRGHKGIFKATMRATGVAGHSSQDVGPSAIHRLVESLGKVLAREWGQHALFGQGSLNVGCLHGGVAPNVVADAAEARILVRTVESPETVEARLRSCFGDGVELELGPAYAPQEFHVPSAAGNPEDSEGDDSRAEPIVVAFGTDAPFLRSWGTPLLCGPGRILDAHTDHERISKRAFSEAVALYERTVAELLAS